MICQFTWLGMQSKRSNRKPNSNTSGPSSTYDYQTEVVPVQAIGSLTGPGSTTRPVASPHAWLRIRAVKLASISYTSSLDNIDMVFILRSSNSPHFYNVGTSCPELPILFRQETRKSGTSSQGPGAVVSLNLDFEAFIVRE